MTIRAGSFIRTTTGRFFCASAAAVLCLSSISINCLAAGSDTAGLQDSGKPATLTGPGNGNIGAAPFKLKPLPPEPTGTHDTNSTLDMGPFRMSSLIQVPLLRPMKLEASYNEPLSLREALNYALENNLPIKISRESWNYQRFQLFGSVVSALPVPSFGTGYTLTGSHISPGDTHSNATVWQTSVRYPVFQGGSAVYGMLAQFYRDKGWKQSYFQSINDSLLNVYQNYQNLVLQNALLEIRAKSLDLSESQLKLNNTLYQAGAGTQFAIMQSRTQLATDRQAMLAQQVAVRQAALALAFSLNLPMAANLVPQEETIKEAHIVNEKMPIDDLINLALQFRPELRQYEMFRLAAARNVQVAASALYPSASFVTSYTYANTVSKQPGAGTGGGALGTAGAGVFGGLFDTYQQGFNLSWSLPNLGLNTVFNIYSARALSRQSLLQANQELLLVTEQVRSDYLTALTNREQIDSAAYAVSSAKEELRQATLRLRSGLGTNLELIQAQRDYINALTAQAQAIVNSNLAQAQLLHDTGVISVETLTRGYRPGSFVAPKK